MNRRDFIKDALIMAGGLIVSGPSRRRGLTNLESLYEINDDGSRFIYDENNDEEDYEEYNIPPCCLGNVSCLDD